MLPDRHGSSEKYRYGYQGSEKDDEVKGEGNSYTTHYRLLDSRVGRWLTKDPKSTSFESPYASMRNNPILFNDKLGDSIKTKFSGIENEKIKTVPAVVQKMFNDEYGIKVGYNSKTDMLFYDGVVSTNLTISKSAQKDVMGALVETDVKKINSYGVLEFGYDLKAYNGSGDIYFGGSNRFSPIAGIDLDDFTADGKLKGYIYNNIPIRAYNMARVFEHEFFGHVIGQVGDNPIGVRDEINPGGAENVVNKYRIEMNLPIRISYGAAYYRGAVFFGSNLLNKQDAKKVAKDFYNRLKDYVDNKKGSVADIPMIIEPKKE